VLVGRVALVNSDLATGYTVQLVPGGAAVAGQVTLDNCGYTFTSEANRVARRQVTIMDAHGNHVGASNEVVAYDTAAHAAQALAQFRASVLRCPKNVYERSTVRGQPPLRYDLSVEVTDPALPVKDNAVARLVVTPKGSTKPLYGVLIFQRQGSVLDGIYLLSATKPTAADDTALAALALITGRRLAAI
jgi:hypothetical protein